eukprot:gene32367-43243_t
MPPTTRSLCLFASAYSPDKENSRRGAMRHDPSDANRPHPGASPLYTPEQRRRRDATRWTLVQGILAPVQFLVFLISLTLVLRYLATGEGAGAATLSIVVKTVTLYTIMITGSIWEKVVFDKWLFAESFFWEDVFSMLVLALLTLDPQHALQTLRRPAAYLPLLLFAFMAVGVLWSMQPFGAAIKWVGPYAKLLLIPLLMATAFTPRQALQIGLGFVASCAMVMVLSYAALLWPSGPWDWFKSPGVPFKDNAVQSECLALCAYGLAIGAVRIMRQGDTRRAAALLLLALLFFADVFLIYISKTGMLVAAALFGLFLIEVGGWKRAVVLGA